MTMPIVVADADWYQRARTRMLLEDADFATAGVAEGLMLLHLLKVQVESIILVVAANLALPDGALVIDWLAREPNIWQYHALVITGPETAMPRLPQVPVVPTPLDRDELTYAVAQAALSRSVRPRMRLPITDAAHHDSRVSC